MEKSTEKLAEMCFNNNNNNNNNNNFYLNTVGFKIK